MGDGECLKSVFHYIMICVYNLLCMCYNFIYNIKFEIIEEIIRRRLLFDGEGTGDERRLNVLLKTFLSWCNSNDTPDAL